MKSSCLLSMGSSSSALFRPARHFGEHRLGAGRRFKLGFPIEISGNPGLGWGERGRRDLPLVRSEPVDQLANASIARIALRLEFGGVGGLPPLAAVRQDR